MKLVKFLYNESSSYGVLEGDKVKQLLNSIFDDNYQFGELDLYVDQVELVLPLSPSKVIALGHNYKDLVGPKENYPEPVVFLKPPSAVIGHNTSIEIKDDRKTWIEVELGIVVKKECKNVSVNDAKNYILGYTIGNDVTMQNVENRDHHLARSKGWDTFCPLGNTIDTDVETSDLKMLSKINGNITQNSTTANRILNDYESLSFVSKFFTLNPGDVILTGTPANAENSIVSDGDLVELEIENIGVLSNYVKSIY